MGGLCATCRKLQDKDFKGEVARDDMLAQMIMKLRESNSEESETIDKDERSILLCS
jgi:hypothetical protein